MRMERPAAKCVPPAESWLGERFVDHSLLQGAMRQVARKEADCWRLMASVAESDPGCGAAVATLLGLAVGDSVGGPLEFLPVDGTFDELDTTRPCVVRGQRDGDGRLIYRHAYNRFHLKPGQWTDDTSMALCLADSLLVKNGYDGGDLRVRWHMWWFHGYCNAFRYDERRYGRSSVGLGGNVAKSLADVEHLATRGHRVPPIYGSVTNDAGNGSIMRLAPVPIAYSSQPREAMKVAILQSRASHPSCDAAACCAFMAFFVAQAITQHKRSAVSGEPAPSSEPKEFISTTVEGFLNSGFEEMEEYQSMEGCGRADGLQRISALLKCQPLSLKEANWDWKAKEPQISEAVTARLRDRRYNGHPIIDTYWGAYCMDGLAMALWGLWHSSNLAESIMKTVNLLGDADTTGAICGQLAGALYGWPGLVGDGWGRVRLSELQRWDPCAEIGIRAALLYHYGPLQVLQVELQQKEGHPTVRVFDRAVEDVQGRSTVGEIASGSRVWQLARERDFAQVIGQDPQGKATCGWVGIKNVVRIAVRDDVQDDNTGISFEEEEYPPVTAYPSRTLRPPDAGSSRRSLSAEPLPMGSRGRGL